MTRAVPIHEGWFAFYADRNGKWKLARDARGQPITCDTEELAYSVAQSRRRRLKIWR